LVAAGPCVVFGACTGGKSDATVPAYVEVDGSFGMGFCDLPGSLVFGPNGKTTLVAGGESAPALTWMTLPSGFCAHYFAHVPRPRQLRFAPGGELFVASPITATAGGAPPGLGSIIVLADDNFDGYADGQPSNNPVFLGNLPSTQGIAFGPGSFYYQDATRIMMLPYATGERSAPSVGSQLADITVFTSSLHWPKTIDIADDGTIYAGNGGDQEEVCADTQFPRPFHGGVLRIDGTPGGTPVAQGLRNPIAIRCEHGHDLCLSAELALDGSGGSGGREKLVPIRDGDDWGYPCCATANVPYAGVGNPNCSNVPPESVAFIVGDTPFGFDFEPGLWPAPYTNDILLVLHGAFASWKGERVVAIPRQPNGLPVAQSEIDSGLPTVTDFATGWDDGVNDHGRPAAATFAADGRLFIANDVNGDIFWIAPVGLNASVRDAGTDAASDAEDDSSNDAQSD
jgi:glucose/arabinose dehydrogenase